jgi:hypothetical protein
MRICAVITATLRRASVIVARSRCSKGTCARAWWQQQRRRHNGAQGVVAAARPWVPPTAPRSAGDSPPSTPSRWHQRGRAHAHTHTNTAAHTLIISHTQHTPPGSSAHLCGVDECVYAERRPWPRLVRRHALVEGLLRAAEHNLLVLLLLLVLQQARCCRQGEACAGRCQAHASSHAWL